MAVAPLTEVTPDLLDMTWPNVDAMRMYFKRRKTSVAQLGLVSFVVSGSGVIKVAPAGPAPAPVESAGADAGGDAGGGAEDPFEAWATEVDGLLQDANEAPELEAVLQELWQAETLPADAVAEIVARRADALERSVTAEEASCADCDASRACWGAPDQCQVRLEARLGDTAPSVVQEPVESEPLESGPADEADAALDALVDLGAVIVEGAEHPGVTAIREQAEVDAATQDSDPIPDVPLPTSFAEQRRLDRQAAPDVVAPEMAPAVAPVEAPVTEPEPAAPALRSEREFLGILLRGLETLGMVPEEIVVEVTRAVRQRIGELGPDKPVRKRSREDRLPAIVAALERETGASGAEMQALLGWDNMPGPWFFKEWARKAGRLNDLTELPKVGGVRRWRLLVR